MDRQELKLIAIAICAVVIACRLPGIFWPERLKAFLASYRSLGDRMLAVIGALLLCLGAAVLSMLLKTMPLAAVVVLAGGLALLAAGILHLRPASLRAIAGAIERRSAFSLRLFSILSAAAVVAVGVYLALRA
ncbi:MAG: hypothetical protein PHN82_12280 [bacterium]|nr:hypothetical protein [bacterium]